MNTKNLRALAATALAFAVAIEAFDGGAATLTEKVVESAVRANSKPVAKAAKKPAKRKAKTAKVAAKAAPKSTPKKKANPADKVDDASARMQITTAIHAGFDTKSAILKVTKLSDATLTRLLLAMKADKSILMTGERRGAKYHAPPKSMANGAGKTSVASVPEATIEA